MKKIIFKVISSLIAVIPIISTVAITLSANSIATPVYGQPVPPKTIKKYRKF